MLSPDVRKRLEELNRGALRVARKPESHALSKKTAPLLLEEAVTGQVIESESGRFLLWERGLDQVVGCSEPLHSAYSLVFDRGGFAGDPSKFHPDIQALLEADPGHILYLDIETTGLSSGPIFLIGLLTYEARSLILRQLLARDYSEESAMLSYLAKCYPKYRFLVTFNGKSFDCRYLQERFIATAIPCSHEFQHLDLLHEGRRHWKELLPDCKLQTLERFVSGRRRPGDIAGARIPEAYHEFVRTGDARELRQILQHNALDLITMVEVLLHILQGNSTETAIEESS